MITVLSKVVMFDTILWWAGGCSSVYLEEASVVVHGV